MSIDHLGALRSLRASAVHATPDESAHRASGGMGGGGVDGPPPSSLHLALPEGGAAARASAASRDSGTRGSLDLRASRAGPVPAPQAAAVAPASPARQTPFNSSAKRIVVVGADHVGKTSLMRKVFDIAAASPFGDLSGASSRGLAEYLHQGSGWHRPAQRLVVNCSGKNAHRLHHQQTHHDGGGGVGTAPGGVDASQRNIASDAALSPDPSGASLSVIPSAEMGNGAPAIARNTAATAPTGLVDVSQQSVLLAAVPVDVGLGIMPLEIVEVPGSQYTKFQKDPTFSGNVLEAHCMAVIHVIDVDSIIQLAVNAPPSAAASSAAAAAPTSASSLPSAKNAAAADASSSSARGGATVVVTASFTESAVKRVVDEVKNILCCVLRATHMKKFPPVLVFLNQCDAVLDRASNLLLHHHGGSTPAVTATTTASGGATKPSGSLGAPATTGAAASQQQPHLADSIAASRQSAAECLDGFHRQVVALLSQSVDDHSMGQHVTQMYYALYGVGQQQHSGGTAASTANLATLSPMTTLPTPATLTSTGLPQRAGQFPNVAPSAVNLTSTTNIQPTPPSGPTHFSHRSAAPSQFYPSQQRPTLVTRVFLTSLTDDGVHDAVSQLLAINYPQFPQRAFLQDISRMLLDNCRLDAVHIVDWATKLSIVTAYPLPPPLPMAAGDDGAEGITVTLGAGSGGPRGGKGPSPSGGGARRHHHHHAAKPSSSAAGAGGSSSTQPGGGATASLTTGAAGPGFHTVDGVELERRPHGIAMLLGDYMNLTDGVCQVFSGSMAVQGAAARAGGTAGRPGGGGGVVALTAGRLSLPPFHTKGASGSSAGSAKRSEISSSSAAARSVDGYGGLAGSVLPPPAIMFLSEPSRQTRPAGTHGQPSRSTLAVTTGGLGAAPSGGSNAVPDGGGTRDEDDDDDDLARGNILGSTAFEVNRFDTSLGWSASMELNNGKVVCAKALTPLTQVSLPLGNSASLSSASSPSSVWNRVVLIMVLDSRDFANRCLLDYNVGIFRLSAGRCLEQSRRAMATGGTSAHF